MNSIKLIFLIVVSRLSNGSSRVMVTQYSDLVHWTCFSTTLSTDCCREIEASGLELGISNPHNCELLIAEVPKVPLLHDYDMAKFSLVLQNHKSHDSASEQVLQHRWEDRMWKNQPSPASPFFWNDMKDLDQSITLQSILSHEGGMHLQMTSTLGQELAFESYFLVMTVPESMFVDLDDFLIDSKYTLHASGVCDIEKPAFVSGQHVLMVEVQSGSNLIQHTKWHIRYPAPSQGGADSIRNFPAPQVVFVKDGVLYHHRYLAKLPDVSVATGYEQDGDFVMWATMVACWIGVWSMLRDISSVSYWDP